MEPRAGNIIAKSRLHKAACTIAQLMTHLGYTHPENNTPAAVTAEHHTTIRYSLLATLVILANNDKGLPHHLLIQSLHGSRCPPSTPLVPAEAGLSAFTLGTSCSHFTPAACSHIHGKHRRSHWVATEHRCRVSLWVILLLLLKRLVCLAASWMWRHFGMQQPATLRQQPQQ